MAICPAKEASLFSIVNTNCRHRGADQVWYDSRGANLPYMLHVMTQTTMMPQYLFFALEYTSSENKWHMF